MLLALLVLEVSLELDRRTLVMLRQAVHLSHSYLHGLIVLSFHELSAGVGPCGHELKVSAVWMISLLPLDRFWLVPS